MCHDDVDRAVPSELLFIFGPLGDDIEADTLVCLICPVTGGNVAGNGGGSKNVDVLE